MTLHLVTPEPAPRAVQRPSALHHAATLLGLIATSTLVVILATIGAITVTGWIA